MIDTKTPVAIETMEASDDATARRIWLAQWDRRTPHRPPYRDGVPLNTRAIARARTQAAITRERKQTRANQRRARKATNWPWTHGG
jgi:hypothetical protein